MSYAKILNNLKNLPEGERLLAAHVYFYYDLETKREECGCVLGKGLPKMRSILMEREAHKLNEKAIDTLLEWGHFSRADLEGMTLDEARALQSTNDSYRYDQFLDRNDLLNRYARYLYIVHWLEMHLLLDGMVPKDA